MAKSALERAVVRTVRTTVKQMVPASTRRQLHKRMRSARGFEAGKTGRRLSAIPAVGLAINSQIRAYGKTVVARSRYLAANNAYAAAAKEAYVAALVGTGIKPAWLGTDKDAKKAIQKAWLRWTDESDADGLTDFYGQQAVIASEMFEAGECFVRMRERRDEDGLSVPLQLQILPSEMLPTDDNQTLPNGGRIECGIEFNVIGQRVAYWFLRNHPGERFQFQPTRAMKVRVPADEVLHLFRPIRAGQIRGVPHTLAGMITLAMLDLYDYAELERKRVAALFGAFVTRPRDESDEDDPFSTAPTLLHDGTNEASDFGLEPGVVIDLAEGQDIKFASPADVGVTYEPFQYRQLLRGSAGFGVPYAEMTGDLKQTSYGSLRGGMIAYRRRIEMQQWHVMIYQLCRPVWNRWFTDAVLAGAIPVSATEFLNDPADTSSVKWTTPRWEWIDPLKDIQAEKLMVDSGFKARSDVIEATGSDPEEVDARILADQERAAELGITFIQLSANIVVSPGDSDSLVAPDTGSDNLDFG